MKTERNCYYYIIGKKNKSGKIVYDNSKRRIGQYYIQELFELNRLTEKKYKLYITLPKTNLYTNGYYRIFGNTTFDGSGCIIKKLMTIHLLLILMIQTVILLSIVVQAILP